MTALLAAVLLLSQILCQLLVTVECDCQLPSGYLKYRADNTALKIHSDKVSWYEARDQCISEGAHLAFANTSAKIALIKTRGWIGHEIFSDIWVGIHRYLPGKSGNWVSVSGLPVGIIPWRDFRDNGDTNCAMTSINYDMLTNFFCHAPAPFACEKSLAGVECGCELPSGYVKYTGDNTGMKLHSEEVPWPLARERCALEGANLAFVNSPEKLDFFRNMTESRPTWISMLQPTGDGGHWVRSETDQPVIASPDAEDMRYEQMANCTAVIGSSAGGINNIFCFSNHSFVCEISLAEGCPDPVGPQGS